MKQPHLLLVGYSSHRGSTKFDPLSKDYKTDTIIQSTLRSQLGDDVTVITIAHRLQTIMDADKIVRFLLSQSVIASLRVCIRWSLTTDVLYVTYPHPDSCPIFTFSYRSSSIVPRSFSRTNKGCCERWLMGVVTRRLFTSSLEVNHRMRSL